MFRLLFFGRDGRPQRVAIDRGQTVLLMCRSGGRSAKAVDALATEGGLTTVYSVVDGFEGDKDDNGRRNVNGWKNSGEPWTTKIPATYLYTAQ